MYCSNCRNPLNPQAQFCGHCGTPTDQQNSSTAPQPLVTQSPPCPTCGGFRDDPSQYCAKCGAPPLRPEGMTGRHPGQPTRGYSNLARNALIAAAVAFVLAAGGVGAYFLLSSPSSSSSGSGTTDAAKRPSVTEQAIGIESPVKDVQQALTHDAASMTLTHAAMLRLTTDARTYGQSVDSAHRKTEVLTGTTTSDRAVIDALRRLLSAQTALAETSANLPTDVSELTPDDMAPVRDQTDALNSAAATFGGRVSGAAPTVASSTWTRLTDAIGARERKGQLKVFVVKMENLLTQSSEGRSQLVSALSQTQDHCSIPPDEAARQFHEVADNRQSLLDQASALNVPSNDAAHTVLDLLQQALRHSIAADNAYASWMTYLYDYYYRYPVGCPGTVPTDDNYQQAVDDSGSATQAKTDLAAAFNPLARQFDLRANWTASQI